MAGGVFGLQHHRHVLELHVFARLAALKVRMEHGAHSRLVHRLGLGSLRAGGHGHRCSKTNVGGKACFINCTAHAHLERVCGLGADDDDGIQGRGDRWCGSSTHLWYQTGMPLSVNGARK